MKTKVLEEKEKQTYVKLVSNVIELPQKPVLLQGSGSEPPPWAGEVGK